MALPHQFAADVELAARAGGERSTGAIGAAHGAGKGAAVDELAKGRLCGRPAAVAPGAGAARLLQLGRLNAGEPHRGCGDTHEVAGQSFGAPLQRFARTDDGQLAGDAGEVRPAAASRPGEDAE